MGARDEIDRGVRRLRARVTRAADELRDAARQAADSDGSVQVSSRRNIVVARNVGGSGSVQGVSARQVGHIRQRGGKTVDEEWTESRESTGGEG